MRENKTRRALAVTLVLTLSLLTIANTPVAHAATLYPINGSILINAGAMYTMSKNVVLTIEVLAPYPVSDMRFSNWPNAEFWGRWFPGVYSHWYPYATSFPWTLTGADGVKTVTAQFRTPEGMLTSTLADAIILDTVPPTGAIVIEGGIMYTTSTSVTLTLAYFDKTSGVLQVRYSNDGVTWTAWEAPSTTRAWTLTAGDGTKTVYYQIQDTAGWVSTYSDTIILDTTPPTGSIIINGGDTYTDTTLVTLMVTYSNPTSGVKQVRYRNAGYSWGPWELPAPTKKWTLPPVDGTKWVEFQIQDNAGLLSIVYSDSIILDTTAPTTTVSHANPSDYVYLSASDSTSGVQVTYYRIDYGPWYLYAGGITLPGPAPYTHVINYYSIDKAGNHENAKTLELNYLTISTNIPQVTPVNHPWQEGWYTSTVTGWTPTAPDTYWSGWSMFGFQTWEKDTVKSPGNPVGFAMTGPHWAKAGYLGIEVSLTGADGLTAHLSMHIRSEMSQTLSMQIRVVGPGIDQTFAAGSLPVTGGIDITSPMDYTLPDGLPVGHYDVYFKFFDPATSSERAESRIAFDLV